MVLDVEVVVVVGAGLAVVVVDLGTIEKVAMKQLLMVLLEDLVVLKTMSRDLLVGVVHMSTALVDHSVVGGVVVSAMLRMEMLNACPGGSMSDIVALGVGMYAC